LKLAAGLLVALTLSGWNVKEQLINIAL